MKSQMRTFLFLSQFLSQYAGSCLVLSCPLWYLFIGNFPLLVHPILAFSLEIYSLAPTNVSVSKGQRLLTKYYPSLLWLYLPEHFYF